MDKWKDYDAGKLTPPCVVQYDIVGKEHLVWVWDGSQIVGPLSMPIYDEAKALEIVMAMKNETVITIEQDNDLKISELMARIDVLETEVKR